MAKEKGKKLDIALRAISGNLVFSDKSVWAFYQVKMSPYDFLSNGAKIGLAQNTTMSFSNLMTDRTSPLEVHLINTYIPLDAEAWERQVLDEISEGRETPGLRDFVEGQKYFLEDQDYSIRVSYVGIELGKRGAIESSAINPLEVGVKGAWEEFKEWARGALSAPPEEISQSEESNYQKIEQRYFSLLSQDFLSVERVTAEDLLLMIKRQFYPAMLVPFLDVDHENRVGPGDLALELYSGIKKRWGWMEFTQQIYSITVTGYRATLTFSKFPKRMLYPVSAPFLYLPTMLKLPYTTYARIKLLPTAEMKKEVIKKQKELDDEISNMSAAGSSSVINTHAEASEALGDSVMMDEILSSDKSPWVQGTYRIVIEAQSEAQLKDAINNIKLQYADLGINVTHTTGDQTSLFLEQMPGDKLRENSFQQTTNLYQVGTSGFNFSTDVGDKILGRELKEDR